MFAELRDPDFLYAALTSDIVCGSTLLEGEVGSHPALISAVQKQLQESEFAIARIGVSPTSAAGGLQELL